jgi:L,D-transpeptidase ErfK/SrfK
LKLLLVALLLRSAQIFAGAYPGDEEVIGTVTAHVVQGGDSLMEVARRYDVGYEQMAAANPGVDPFVPGEGATVTVPTAWIVPKAAPGTIVVNVSEMRLYFLMVHRGATSVVTFPVGIGDEGIETPLGTYTVIEKETHPTWHVPPSIKRERPYLPDAVPPGPDNPLGTHALRLSARQILIHGTNRPWGVGRRVSHGCIRLYPEDIPELSKLVPVGTAVAVVREPVKVGTDGERVYLEVHRDDGLGLDYAREANRLLAARGLLGRVNPERLQAVILEKNGLPADVSDSAPGVAPP